MLSKLVWHPWSSSSRPHSESDDQDEHKEAENLQSNKIEISKKYIQPKDQPTGASIYFSCSFSLHDPFLSLFFGYEILPKYFYHIILDLHYTVAWESYGVQYQQIQWILSEGCTNIHIAFKAN